MNTVYERIRHLSSRNNHVTDKPIVFVICYSTEKHVYDLNDLCEIILIRKEPILKLLKNFKF